MKELPGTQPGLAAGRDLYEHISSLEQIAGQIPGMVMLLSITRRLDCSLETAEFRVRDWYEPIAKWLLAQRAGGDYRLSVDGGKVGFGQQFLVAAFTY